MNSRIFLFSLLFLSLHNVFSQGGLNCENAVLLTTAGEYISDNSLGEQWFSYKNNTSEVLALTISSCDLTTEDTHVLVYEGCFENFPLVYNNDFCDKQSTLHFFVNPSETVYIRWLDFYTQAKFSWNFNVRTLGEGDSCENPKEVTEGTNYANGPQIEQWYTYTNTTLESQLISASSEVITYVYLYSECSSIIDATIQNIDYVIEPGETVIFYWQDTPEWEFTSRTIQEGDACTMPLQAVEGLNKPNTVSKNQWFVYTNNYAQDKVMEINFPENKQVEIFGACDDAIPLEKSIALLTDVGYIIEQGQTVYLRFYLVENWNLTIRDIEEGDLCSNAIESSEGLNFNSHKAMFQWTYFTNTTAEAVDYIFALNKQNREMYFTSSCDMSTSASTSDTHSGTLQVGETIYFSTYNTSMWSFKTLDKTTGSTCEDPIIAQIGINYPNYLKAEQFYYYKNNSPETVYLKLKSEYSVGTLNAIGLMTSCDDEVPSFIDRFHEGIIDLKAGGDFYMHAYSIEPWELSFYEPEEGEFCNISKEVILGPNMLSHKNGSVWYTYTNDSDATQNLTITTCGETSLDTYIGLYNVCGGNEIVGSDDDCGTQSTINYSILKNETIYINFSDDYLSPTSSYTWQFLIDGVTSAEDEILPEVFSVFPTVTEGEVSLSQKANKVQVLNMWGEEKLNQNNTKKVNLVDLVAGMYILRAEINNDVQIVQVIKK